MYGYFDNAATTYPKPECVYSFMDSFYRKHGGNAGRGQYKLAAEASRITAETRILVQQILHCENKDVLFVPSDTIALNMVIQGCINDRVKTVYITPFEHNSVTRILHHYELEGRIKVKLLPLTELYAYDLTMAEVYFKQDKPDMVIMSHASNVCGLIAPVLDIFCLAKKYNAITVVDMAQTAGLVELDVGSDLIDFATFAGHKTFYGPFGISGFVKKTSVPLKPLLFGGTGVDSINQDMPNIVPYKYEAGSSNIQAVAGLHAALEWYKANKNKICDKEAENHLRLIEVLEDYPNITIVGPSRNECIGVVSVVFDDYSADSIGDILGSSFDIAVRTGLECAPLAHETLGTLPAGTVRFSVGYFTDEEDFGRLQEALRYIEENG